MLMHRHFTHCILAAFCQHFINEYDDGGGGGGGDDDDEDKYHRYHTRERSLISVLTWLNMRNAITTELKPVLGIDQFLNVIFVTIY